MSTPDQTRLPLDSEVADGRRHDTDRGGADMPGQRPGGRRFDTDRGDTRATGQHGGGGDRRPRWLGLTITHRRLFDALQCEWLLPPHTDPGTLLGVGRYVTAPNVAPTGGHPIPIRLRLDATKLPALEVPVLRDQTWMTSRLDALEPSDTALHWPGPLPAFTIAELSVSTAEERARLVGLAAGVSNVELPTVVTVGGDSLDDEGFEPGRPPPDPICAFTLPNDENAIHGAMSMALWAVPHIEPWLDLLTASLAADRTALPNRAEAVGASWWRFPPWAPPPDAPPPDPQESLWLAAVDVFRRRTTASRVDSAELAEEIADQASRSRLVGTRGAASAWLLATRETLRAERAIQLEGWKTRPVDLAIQLVLNRPDPDRFRTWFSDRPELSPAVAWSAATLCGLLHGYRRLDTSFRGKALQRELVSIHAMRLSGDEPHRLLWSSVTENAPTWRRDGDLFVLSWDGRDFCEKPAKARGRWYTSDLTEDRVRDAALALARGRHWPCVRQEIAIEDDEIALSGRGDIEVRSEPRRLAVRGGVRMRLPHNAGIETTLDDDAFRRAVATESGPLPDPPAPAVSAGRTTSPTSGEMPRPRGAEFDPDVPGLLYIPDFITPEDERRLTETIDAGEWRGDLKRRVQHYGWRYDYTARQVDSSMRLGSLPAWANDIGRRLVAEGLLAAPPDQVIVNEYKEDQGISRHVDSPGFADGIVTISLLESWEMVFRHQRGTQKRKVNKRLERRSAMILTRAARYDWTHEIPARRHETDPSTGKRWKRKRRISLTFRRVVVAENATTTGRRTPEERPHPDGRRSAEPA